MATAGNTVHKIQKFAYSTANNTMVHNTDVVVQGNLTVRGTQTYAQTQTLLVQDNIITLNAAINQSGVPIADAGIEIDRGSELNVSLLWKESEAAWKFTNDGVNYETLGGGSAGSYANSAFLQANAAFQSANNVAPQVQPAFDRANAAFIQANSAYASLNASSAWSVRHAFIASAGQTSFVPPSGYLAGYIDVFYNGLKLYGNEDYTATDGINITLTNPAVANSIIEVVGLRANVPVSTLTTLSSSITGLLNRQTFFATANQTIFTTAQQYRAGYVDVYYNGLKMVIPDDVVAADGSTINFIGLTPTTNDVIEVVGLSPNVSLANAIPITGGSVSGGLTLAGNLIPAATNTYYLGSETLRWKSLYVSANSVDIDGLVLSNSGGTLAITTQGGTPSTFIDTFARGQANAAFNSANNVAPQVQPAFNTANAAFAAANSANAAIANVNVYGANTVVTSYFAIPQGNTAQRPASAANGHIRYNTTLGRLETYLHRGGWVGIVQDNYDVEYLIVAGGGGGGGWGGGGGGAGGLRSSVQTESSGGGSAAEAKLTVTPGTSYSIIVGGGGAHAAQGSNSSLASITSFGGGYGAGSGAPVSNPQQAWVNATSGGSGGGATWIYTSSNGVGGTGTSGQGYPGATITWNNTGNHASGGGGGAGAIGVKPADANAPSGNGGIGVVSTIDGNNYYYAGGGGAATHYSSGGSGGLGGGGGGASVSGYPVGQGGGSARNSGAVGVAGASGGAGGTNTGGGGGGGSPTTSNYAGGTGGSGIVILRYLGTQRGTGGTVTTVGSYTVHTFTGSGTFIA